MAALAAGHADLAPQSARRARSWAVIALPMIMNTTYWTSNWPAGDRPRGFAAGGMGVLFRTSNPRPQPGKTPPLLRRGVCCLASRLPHAGPLRETSAAPGRRRYPLTSSRVRGPIPLPDRLAARVGGDQTLGDQNDMNTRTGSQSAVPTTATCRAVWRRGESPRDRHASVGEAIRGPSPGAPRNPIPAKNAGSNAGRNSPPGTAAGLGNSSRKVSFGVAVPRNWRDVRDARFLIDTWARMGVWGTSRR